jgi:hypothetical protein
MPIQFSIAVRNARLDSIETTIGTSARLRILTGTPPANCAAAETGTILATLVLPSDWLANAASGAKALAGTWTGTAVASGTAGYYRIYDSSVTTCHEQGTITATGGGGDLTFDNVSIANGQTINITTFTKTDGNA